jgi:hypothetical protein
MVAPTSAQPQTFGPRARAQGRNSSSSSWLWSRQSLRLLWIMTGMAVLWQLSTRPLTLQSSSSSSSKGSSDTSFQKKQKNKNHPKKQGSSRFSSSTRPKRKTKTKRWAPTTTTYPIQKNSNTKSYHVYQNMPVSDFTNLTVLKHNDPSYTPGAWDGAPVVLENYKLLFFTTPKVGCTGTL